MHLLSFAFRIEARSHHLLVGLHVGEGGRQLVQLRHTPMRIRFVCPVDCKSQLPIGRELGLQVFGGEDYSRRCVRSDSASARLIWVACI